MELQESLVISNIYSFLDIALQYQLIQMYMNYNDLFNQIGLIVEEDSQSGTQEIPNYEVLLEIELSEGQNQMLKICKDDDPHRVAQKFCRTNGLNKLAQQIVQTKIVEAKQKQEIRFKKPYRSNALLEQQMVDYKKKKNNLHNKPYLPTKESNKSTERINNRSKSKSVSKTPRKTNSPKKTKKEQNTHLHKKKPNQIAEEASNRLYMRGLVKNKKLQDQRIKKKQTEQKEVENLTFKPKIDRVSEKIVEFRRQNRSEAEKQNKREKANKHAREVEDLKQCTFKPQINKVSELILYNKSVYRDEYDHFTTLFKNANERKQKLNAKAEKLKQNLFHPQINEKMCERVSSTFFERLEKSLVQKRQIKQGVQLDENQYSFQPKVGRGPRQAPRQHDESIWEHLYREKTKKYLNSNTSFCKSTEIFGNNACLGENSKIYYQNLLQSRIAQIFKTLDGNCDEFISPNQISIEKLSKVQLIFLKPIFEQMDEIDATLNYHQFKKAVIILLQDSDTYHKGQFISQKYKKQEKQIKFKPEINKKSKQIALSRITTCTNIHDQLYEQGLKEIQRKQFYLEKQRARLEEVELNECSFKPALKNTSKYYIDKILGKKGEIGDQSY